MSPLEMNNRAAEAPAGTNGAADTRRRVILVGRTGLDGSLSTDPLTEVVVTVDALGAIGELSRVGAAQGGATVVVGPAADPGAEAGRFVAGLRQLDPAVRVVVVGDQTRGVYDEALAAGSESLRGASSQPPQRTAMPRSPVVVEVPPAPASTPPLAPLSLEPGEAIAPPVGAEPLTGETSLVEALLHGRDLLLPALEMLRGRLGGQDVFFHPASSPSPTSTATSDASTDCGTCVGNVPVLHAGIEHGRLLSSSLASPMLESSARWLGSWLALRSQHDHLRHAAFTDELTGAYNRRYFARFLTGALEQARQRRVPLTVLVFDIDNFKTYNDRYGHAAGDEILSETSRLMRSVIRPADKVCRIGGDEFAVIFYDPKGPRATRVGADGQIELDPTAPAPTNAPIPAQPTPGTVASIYDIARRFQRQICDHRFPKLGAEAPGTLTISGGMATYPWDGNNADELLQRADELALQSKRAGKNVITYGPGADRVCRM